MGLYLFKPTQFHLRSTSLCLVSGSLLQPRRYRAGHKGGHGKCRLDQAWPPELLSTRALSFATPMTCRLSGALANKDAASCRASYGVSKGVRPTHDKQINHILGMGCNIHF